MNIDVMVASVQFSKISGKAANDLFFACSGLGCEFVLESCNNTNTYPYLCDTDILHQCTFDHIAKVEFAVFVTLQVQYKCAACA